MRKFEEVKKDCLKFPLIETQKPIRADKGSAGYDFFSKEDYVLKNGESHVFGQIYVLYYLKIMYF